MNCTVQNCSNSTTGPPLSLTLPSTVITIGISIMSIWMNIVVISVVIAQKKMHTHCFILIAGSAFGSLLLAIYYLTTNAAKIGEYNGLWSLSKRMKISCLFMQFYMFAMVSFSTSSQTILLVALDRLFSSVSPVRYRQMDKKYPLGCLALCGIYAIIEILVVLFAGPSLNAIIPTCKVMADVIGKDSYTGLARINLSASILSVITYVVMFLYVHLKRSKSNNATGNGGFATAAEKQIFLRQQAAILPAAKLLLVMYFITGIIPDLIYNFAPPLTTWFDVAGYLKASSSLVEMISLTLRSQLFRDSVRQLIGKKTGQVEVVGSQSAWTVKS